jgi:hypothetical protein
VRSVCARDMFVGCRGVQEGCGGDVGCWYVRGVGVRGVGIRGKGLGGAGIGGVGVGGLPVRGGSVQYRQKKIAPQKKLRHFFKHLP